MTPGAAARKILGPYAKPVGEAYRRIFVDLSVVIETIADRIPRGAHCLDIGGGDGMGTNLLLDRRADLTVTMIDLAARIGAFLEPRHSGRVTLKPATSIAEFGASGAKCQAAIVTDVIHHVPMDMRAGFFKDLALATKAMGCTVLVIKDIGRGHVRSGLSLLSDWYVTGDRHVALVSAAEVDAFVTAAFGEQRIVSKTHLVPDAPNYCLVYDLRA